MPFARLLAVVLVIVPSGTAPAQEWWPGLQQEDGRWAAAEDGSPRDADLRVTAWGTLALLGYGSTLHSGSEQRAIQAGCLWLLGQQDAAGRLGLRADPEWLLDHAIATCALVEAMRSSPGHASVPGMLAAADALSTELARLRPVAGVDLRLWSAFVSKSLRGSGDPSLQQAGERLARVLQALPEATAAVDNAREALALELLLDLDRTEVAANDALPEHWPDDELADPLHTWYAMVLAYRRGGKALRAAGKRFEPVVKAQRRTGVARGTWAAGDGFGAIHGRLGVSALHVLSMECYYRYCHLAFVLD